MPEQQDNSQQHSTRNRPTKSEREDNDRQVEAREREGAVQCKG
jgi:hypothetical protein